MDLGQLWHQGGRFFARCLIVSFVFISTLAQATHMDWDPSSLPENAPCESRTLPRASILFQPTAEWLREHFRVGVERTFSSHALADLYAEGPFKKNIEGGARFYSYFNLSQSVATQKRLRAQLNAAGGGVKPKHIRELMRFLVDILGARDVELHLGQEAHRKYKPTTTNFKLEFNPHFQPYTLLVQTRWGRSAVVTLEPACIEVNFNPASLDTLDAVWGSLEKRAAAAGFFNTEAEGGHGGGSTHMHLGWDQLADNLWLLRPDLTARMIFLPMKYRFLMYFWNNIADHGGGSNVALPFEGDRAEFGSIQEYMFLLSQMAFSQTSVTERAEWIRDYSPAGLGAHYRAVSLQHFITEDNPRLQIRFQRSVRTFREVQLLAETWLRIVAFLLSSDDLFMNMRNSEIWYKPTYKWSPAVMRQEMVSFLNTLGWSESEAAEIMQIGGQEAGHSQFAKFEILDPRFAQATYAFLPSHPHPSADIEVAVPLPSGYSEAWIATGSGANKTNYSDEGWVYPRLQCHPFHRSSSILVFNGENVPSLYTVVTCDHKKIGHYQITLGETIEQAFARDDFALEFVNIEHRMRLLNQYRYDKAAAGARAELELAVLDGLKVPLRALDQRLRNMSFDAYEFLVTQNEAESVPENFADMRINGQPVAYQLYHDKGATTVRFTGLDKILGARRRKDKIEFYLSYKNKSSLYSFMRIRLNYGRDFSTLKPFDPSKLPALPTEAASKNE